MAPPTRGSATLQSFERAGAGGTDRVDQLTVLVTVGVIGAGVAAFFLNGALLGWLGHQHFVLARAARAVIAFPSPHVLPIVGLVGAGVLVAAGLITVGGTRVSRTGAVAFAVGVGLVLLGAFLTVLATVLIVAFYLLIAVAVVAVICLFIALMAG
jgi:hypothetical protein